MVENEWHLQRCLTKSKSQNCVILRNIIDLKKIILFVFPVAYFTVALK